MLALSACVTRQLKFVHPWRLFTGGKAALVLLLFVVIIKGLLRIAYTELFLWQVPVVLLHISMNFVRCLFVLWELSRKACSQALIFVFASIFFIWISYAGRLRPLLTFRTKSIFSKLRQTHEYPKRDNRSQQRSLQTMSLTRGELLTPLKY